MAAKAVEFHPEALAEFRASLAWYLERSEIVASEFAAELDQAVDLVASSPGRWPGG